MTQWIYVLELVGYWTGNDIIVGIYSFFPAFSKQKTEEQKNRITSTPLWLCCDNQQQHMSKYMRITVKKNRGGNPCVTSGLKRMEILCLPKKEWSRTEIYIIGKEINIWSASTRLMTESSLIEFQTSHLLNIIRITLVLFHIERFKVASLFCLGQNKGQTNR